MRRLFLVAFLACLACVSCGDIEPEHHLSVSPSVNEKRLMDTNRLTQLRRDTRERRDFVRWTNYALWVSEVARRDGASERVVPLRSLQRSVRYVAPSPACSSPLPAEVIARESGGDCNATNPGGCNRRGCLGVAQLDAGHFYAVSPWNPNVPGTCYGLDYDACVNKLYAGGAGLCRHWSYCK